MRISNLFERHNRAQTRIEPSRPEEARRRIAGRPGGREPLREQAIDDDHPMANGMRDDLRGSDAIFGLIGTSASMNEAQVRRTADGFTSDVETLMSNLYGQYCRALDDPAASLAGDWIRPSMPPGRPGTDSTNLNDYADQPPSSSESIETFLTGAHKMEHAFGAMGTGEAPELVGTEPVPEILRLFAPAEYAASVKRRPSALPPALARREHHALGIDSPLSVPQSTTFHSDAS